MISAYFDESTDAQKKEFYNIGGVVADHIQWGKFESAWFPMWRELDELGLTFHAADCESNVGVFDKLRRSKCVEIMKEMTTAFLSAKLYSTNSVLDIRAFERYFPEYHAESSWYSIGLFTVISQVGEWGRDVSEPVAVTFDQRPEFEHHAQHCYRSMQQMEGWRGSRYLGAFGFASKKHFPPLQAADFIARESFKFFYQIHEEPDRPIRIPMLRLKGARLQAIFWNEASLSALRTYVDRTYEGDMNGFLSWDLLRKPQEQFLTKLRSQQF